MKSHTKSNSAIGNGFQTVGNGSSHLIQTRHPEKKFKQEKKTYILMVKKRKKNNKK